MRSELPIFALASALAACSTPTWQRDPSYLSQLAQPTGEVTSRMTESEDEAIAPARTHEVVLTSKGATLPLQSPKGVGGSEVNLAIGAQFGGEYTVDTDARSEDRDGDAGFYVRATYDYFFDSGFGVGVFISDATSSNEEGDAFDNGDINYFSLGVAGKYRFSATGGYDDGDILITPGLSLGYARLTPDEGEDSNGLAINFGVDARIRFSSIDVFIEPGFITQPAGGNSDADVTFGPWFYTLVGAGIRF